MSTSGIIALGLSGENVLGNTGKKPMRSAPWHAIHQSLHVRSLAAAERLRRVAPAIEEARASGCSSLRQIAKYLNQKGLSTSRGKQWTASQVGRALERLSRDQVGSPAVQEFLDELRAIGATYAITSDEDGLVLVRVSRGRERWEVEFFENSLAKVEVFCSDGTVFGPEKLADIYRRAQD